MADFPSYLEPGATSDTPGGLLQIGATASDRPRARGGQGNALPRSLEAGEPRRGVPTPIIQSYNHMRDKPG